MRSECSIISFFPHPFEFQKAKRRLKALLSERSFSARLKACADMDLG
jgi:hypothetical protein